MKENKAIVVTSFKGGAAKTTTSLMLSISAICQQHFEPANAFDEVHYFDMDLNGSGACYALLENDKSSIKYFDQYRKIKEVNQFRNKNIVEVPRTEPKISKVLNSYILNPEVKIHGAIHGQGFNRSNADSLNSYDFLIRVKELISQYINAVGEKKSKLLIFDCSPGYQSFTQDLVRSLASVKNLSVNQVFTSTLDNAHVSKTLDTLKYIEGTQEENLEVTQKLLFVNCLNHDEEDNIFSKIKADIKARLYAEGMEILQWGYNQDIPNMNAYSKRRTIYDQEFVEAYYNMILYKQLIK